MLLESMPVGAIPLELTDEQQQQHTAGKPSPVDVIISIREELAEFQRTSSKQALRKAMREALREALLRAVHDADTHPTGDIDPVVEHLRDRGLIPPAPSRASRIKTSTASNSAETAGRRHNRRRFP